MKRYADLYGNIKKPGIKSLGDNKVNQRDLQNSTASAIKKSIINIPLDYEKQFKKTFGGFAGMADRSNKMIQNMEAFGK